MSESTSVLVQTETVGATVVVTGATVLGTVPIGPQGPEGPAGADGAEGPAGPVGADGEGVPVGGTAGQVLTKDSATDFDTSWQDPTGGGGSGVVETIVAGSNIDVDATDPANPIVSVETLVDADIPATIARDAEVTAAVAAEATARDAAIETHRADTTNVHGIADTSALETTAGAQAKADAKVTQTITNGVTTTAPSEDAVFDALANKQPLDADLTALAAANNSAVLAATTAAFLTADETKLDGIEAGAEVNDTAAEILTKLLTVDGAGSGLDADLLDGQSSAAFQAALTAASQAEMEAGTEAALRSMSPLRVAQAIDALAGGGGTVDVVSNVAQDRILGRVSSGSGDSEELTAAQVRTLLDLANLYAPIGVGGVIQFSKPTHGSTRTSTDLGSLNNAWTDSVTTTTALPSVRYVVQASAQCSNDSLMEFAIARDGTVIDRGFFYTAAAGSRQNRGTIAGIDTPSTGAHTYEVYFGSTGSSTVTVASTVDTNVDVSAMDRDGVSSMQLQAVATG